MSKLKSRLPKGGTNLFQAIKAKCVEAEAAGIKLYRLSIGQPTGAALVSARRAASEAVMSELESMHEYQDNGSPGVHDFAQRFVQAHVKRDLRSSDFSLSYLPIPGIKPMLGLIPLACDAQNQELLVKTMTAPGYPTPADWCRYLLIEPLSLTTTPGNRFRFPVSDLVEGTDLIMTNFPANPHGQVATKGFWRKICEKAVEHDIRIFNDAAYAMLAWAKGHSTLTEVAVDYPDLSWAEAFSASKVISNGTGWRVGAIAGSPDFVGDIATIKGNTDSGFVAFAAAGVIEAVENDMKSILMIRNLYQSRIKTLIEILSKHGMRLAVKPGAGFFTLWQLPKKAFGQKIEDAKHFNFLMIEKTGIVGVHFHPYIRYAVVAPVEDQAYQLAIDKAFAKAKVKY
ncbi:aminotransferase class I/II-fold pyridoxal phosphate-dependent enzyme [Patescibacteria group bacterium]